MTKLQRGTSKVRFLIKFWYTDYKKPNYYYSSVGSNLSFNIKTNRIGVQ